MTKRYISKSRIRAAAHQRASSVDSPPNGEAKLPNHIASSVVWRNPSELKPFPGNPRQHPEKQLALLNRSISSFGITNPALVDENGTILAGHARHELAIRRGLPSIPTLTISGLSDSQKRALVIADNRVPERAVWDDKLLREHFETLLAVNYDVELSGFDTGEIDLILDAAVEVGTDTDDAVAEDGLDCPPISRAGDVWELNPHRIICADARETVAYEALLGSERAQMVFSDPPYNVRIEGHAVGRGQTKHRNFSVASGEMSSAEFVEFLTQSIRCTTAACKNGAIEFWCMDWRHLAELQAATSACRLEQKNLAVWVKTNAGQGSFYRSQHELIGVYKNGTGKHINNFGLGASGRYRTNVWTYPGVNSLHPARRGDLALHPTVKPVALVADAIRDCSMRNGIVLDPFGGSGTTILAAERTGRIARVIEIDPKYVDVAIRRWEEKTGKKARNVATGASFADTEPKSRARA